MFKKSFAALMAAFSVVSAAQATTVTATTNPDVYPVWSHVASPAPSTEVHILSVYSAAAGLNSKIPVYVSGTSSKPVTLVLSAYEPTVWALTGPGAKYVSRVVLNGFNISKVTGLPLFSKVISRMGYNKKTGAPYYLAACAVEWPADTRGCDTPGLVSGVEKLLGTPISTFTANDYFVTSFSVKLGQ
jgi:hypothetical protein